MKQYVILCHPGHNRVYFEAAKAFAVYEMAIVAKCLEAQANKVEKITLAGIDYIAFVARTALTADDLAVLARLSFFYALFERDGEKLLPVAMPDTAYLDANIGSILRYTGKTNETFTRMLINIARFSSPSYQKTDLCVLDPIAGKGTTVFEAIAQGYNAYGAEIGDKVVLEAYHFFKKYLERGKYKHDSHIQKLSGPNKSFRATKYDFTLANTKEAYAQKDTREVVFVAGDSRHANAYFKRGSMDVIVGDLPYGVQHANVTGEKQSPLTRSPKLLLEKALPAWRETLAKDGVMALSWNTLVFSREEMTSLFQGQGFDVMTGEDYEQFAHRVDQAILRDIIVAQKQ